ncbi:MAG: N-6 DNA methylase [Bifidobacteriaceae bacterium]|jgi:hypothetical protein|nr:N-6 DNA methylase [Bifidobacteriaceae bacterium]
MPTPLLPIVDSGDFRELFVRQLGWNNPDRMAPLKIRVDGKTYTLTQAAGFKGLRVWVCDQAPARRVQREIDQAVGKDSSERLLVFCGDGYQDWRWPRRAQTGGVNAKLMAYTHRIGRSDQDFETRLRAIEVPLDHEITLVELLSRMRGAFDKVIETESSKAARLMGTLYSALEKSDIADNAATLLLARLLFLLFGDDTGMWGHNASDSDVFKVFIDRHSTDANLHIKLQEAFRVADTPHEAHRPCPGLEKGHPLARLPYINGGLFSDPLVLPPLQPDFRGALLDAADFDWSFISPAIFGSMFQTVKDKAARRAMGEHYTTEENILRTIRPLFLDELEDRLERAWDDKGQLTKLLNDLRDIRILDPACGCGNFLVVAYRELRAIELQALVRRRNLDITDSKVSSARGNLAQSTLDVSQYVGVTIDHFYGIEIEEWPARIAETAMLLVDHLANQQMAEEFGTAPHRLPIKLAPTIVHGNALRTDWASILPPSENVVIVGNPPFVGQYTKTSEQQDDSKQVWGARWSGYLDYVTCWYAKSMDYYGAVKGRWAFVSTNSICQGEATEPLWRPIIENGWRCRFAHRSFRWTTEAAAGAAVHVSIIGFDRADQPRPVLWTYGESGQGEQLLEEASRISPYLVANAPTVLVTPRVTALGSGLSPVTKGSQPTDGGRFFLKGDDLIEARADPIAQKYIRRFVGAKELLHSKDRWCLWLEGITPDEIRSSLFLQERIEAVRLFRLTSKKKATRKKATTAWLFDERRQPKTDYLAIPRHVAESRPYFPPVALGPEVICGDANAMIQDADGFVLAVLSSTMFIQWMRTVGGRIKSDLRFSNTFTYNNFPLPPVSPHQRAELVSGAAAIIAERNKYPNISVAELYDSESMPSALLEAHARVDAVIDKLFSVPAGASPEDKSRILLRRYAKMTGQEEDSVLF